ncbi:pentatricopeptide repeat-containing protein At2g33680-like [Typha latifolia]|uniref:pentatricopeptide repeat-containing protein At2g33680-like n=1 Tax=Typha latifolia TaxID=4733 RepID=UPI003C2B6226
MDLEFSSLLNSTPWPSSPKANPINSRSLEIPTHRRFKSIESSVGFHQRRFFSPRAPQNSAFIPLLPITDANFRLFGCSRIAQYDSDDTLKNYAISLKEWTSRGSLISGKAIHARLLRTGVEPDTFLYDCLLNMYSKCGTISYARRLFDEMPDRDVVGWTAMIAGYTTENDEKEGLRLFVEMHREGIRPNGFAFAAGLKACSVCLDLDLAKQVHGEAIKMQLLSDSYVGSSLVEVYMKCGEMGLAEKVFFSLRERNSVCWNALFSGYSEMGDKRGVIMLFQKLMESETRPSKYNFPMVIKCFAELGFARHARVVHGLLVKIGLEIDSVLGSSLIDMYSKCESVEDAWKVFVTITEPDVVVCSVMISCYDRQDMILEAFELFVNMGSLGIKPNQYIFVAIASAVSKICDQRLCGSLHACILKSGFMMDREVSNAILNMYMKTGAVKDGCKFFDAILSRDLVSWNTLLSGFHNKSCCEQGLIFFNQMVTENFVPNKYTYVSILRSCTSQIASSYGAQVHARILKHNLEGDSHVGKALLDMYANCGNFTSASLIFAGLKERDVFSWTLVISGCAKADQGEQAIIYYREMQREGVSPNESTLASCLRACSNLAALSCGLQFHSWVIKSGLRNAFVSSALVDMYVKCGSIMDAEIVFYGSTLRDEVSWNTIICGYSNHGYWVKALEAFEQMVDEGKKPDETTFLGVLTACSRAGLLSEAQQYFNSLSQVYGMNPTIEHSACMIDILAKAGKLDEAESFIKQMRVKPDASVWRAILGACRMHGNVELAERAAGKLFELESHLDSTCILLSNVYAALGRWSDVSRVRKMLSSHKVKKEPGCSWIEVNGQVHVFLSQDGNEFKKCT